MCIKKKAMNKKSKVKKLEIIMKKARKILKIEYFKKVMEKIENETKNDKKREKKM